MSKNVLSVAEYLNSLNNRLKVEGARIIGEVSELKLYDGKNYLFFSLKDTKADGVITCIMWKNDYRVSGVELRDGLEVVISAYPEVYKPTGRLTFKVDSVELVGEGALKISYEKLKKRLEAEGLFLENRKRNIPRFPHRIGVITSKSGAVINDFLSNIGKFGFEILFVDSRVEGAEATKDLLLALETLKHKDIDVLVIMRGGGSLESFQAFNNEVLVRAILNFPVPVLTGIGHDKDVSLVSLVSDKNVSTPTAVANLLNSGWNEVLSELRLAEEKILSSIELEIDRVGESIDLSAREIERGFLDVFRGINDFIQQSEKSIDLYNPKKRLSQGYSIVRHRGKVLKSVRGVRKNDKIDVILSDGELKSQVI